MENKTKKLLIPMNYDIKIGKARAKGLVGDHWHLLVLDVGKQHWEHYNSRIRGKLVLLSLKNYNEYRNKDQIQIACYMHVTG